MKLPLKLLEKALVSCVKLCDDLDWTKCRVFFAAIYSYMLFMVMIVVLKHNTLQYSVNDFLSSFADVPASSSNSPFPPETSRLCGPGGGEKEAADGD